MPSRRKTLVTSFIAGDAYKMPMHGSYDISVCIVALCVLYNFVINFKINTIERHASFNHTSEYGVRFQRYFL